MMETKNILYDSLIRIVNDITPSGGEFEDYYSGLPNEEAKSTLFNISEGIDTELQLIRKSKLDNELHIDFENLAALLTTFIEDYESFPNQRVREIQLIILLFSHLNESVDSSFDINENVNVDLFALVKVEKAIYEDNFVYYDSSNLTNSIALLNLKNPPDLSTYLNENPLPKELLIHIISKIGQAGILLEEEKYALVEESIKEKPSLIWSCLALHLVKNGLLIHSPYNFDSSPVVHPDRIITQGKNYQQFNDSLYILSEYNYQKDILDKYLRIYHLLENFMYKFPLVELERKHTGQVFSMRDFQRMNDKINNSEIHSLKKLITSIANLIYSSGPPEVKFSTFILDKWQSLHPAEIADKNNLDKLLSYLRIANSNNNDLTFDDVIDSNIHKFFAQLIYGFRNSLVHNRETEFHLTHETLLSHPIINNTAQIVIEKFLIPTVEEIVYFLVINENDLIWFGNSSIKLWDEN